MTSKYLIGAIKIVIFSIIAIVSSYIFFMLLNSKPLPFSLPIQKEPTIILQDIELDDTIQALDLEWYAGDVIITKSSDNKIHILEKSSTQLDKNKWASVRVSNDTLYIQSQNKNNVIIFSFNSPNNRLELQLPDQVYESFSTYLTSGKLSISNFMLDKLYVSMTSGNAHFVEVNAQEIELEMTSGNVNFNGSIEKELKINMTSGNLDLDTSLNSPDRMFIEMTSGNATVTLSELEGFSVDIDKTSGSFRPDAELKKLSDKLYQYLDTTNHYSIEMTSGSFDLNIR